MSNAKLGDNSKGLLRILIYGVQFHADPFVHVQRIADMVAGEGRAKSSPPVETLIAAIDAGLASSDDLAQLIPQPHTDAVIRRFLAALRIRLAAHAAP